MDVVNCEWPELGVDCKIAIVGEAPGSDEALLERPFVGRSGKLLNKMLRLAGIKREECLITNAFNFVLDKNSVKSICINRKEAGKQEDLIWPQLTVPVERGSYVPKHIGIPQLVRLHLELAEVRPNVVIALGSTAVWALMGVAPFGAMKKLVGTVSKAAAHSYKIVPTYHPAYIARNYPEMTRVVANLKKALRESAYPDIRYPQIDITIPTEPEQVEDFLATLGSPAAVDIETLTGMIDNIGFADCFERAMSVPIFRPDNYRSYWKDTARVLSAIAQYLQDPTRIKVMQNGSYDVQWIWERWKIPVRGWTEDTRLLHHALWPESPKDLGTIAALHLDMPSWKMSGGGRTATKKES